MFENCGSKLKSIALFVTIAGIVLGIITAVAVLISDFSEYFGWVGIVAGLSIIGSCYVSGLLVYTIGDIWENMPDTESILRARNSAESIRKEITKAAPTNAPGGWQCSCGHINNSAKKTCSRCGREK